MNRSETSTMSRSHVLVEALHSISASEVAELLVHAVCTRARVVLEPNAKILDLQRFLLVDLECAQ